MRLFFALLVLGLNVDLMALELDEKLTLRIVNTSESKKTILINRGIEDGLVKGDHAKFFVSSGVIARGVCIKLSPTRSVWSIYRKVNASFLVSDQVMKLKITPAVKITKDESRMLVADDSSVNEVKDPRNLGIPLAPGAEDLNTKELTRVKIITQNETGNLVDKNLEIFSMLAFSSDAEVSSPSNVDTDFKKNITNINFRLGGEWYFSQQSQWYHRFSFFGLFSMDKKSAMSHSGNLVEETTNEFGGGVNIYPFHYPSEVHKPIYYFHYMFSLGTTNSRYERSDKTEEVLDGSVLANYLGMGVKYYGMKGFGMRLELTYAIRGDEYAKNSDNVSFIKTRLGPRLLAGFSYRF